MADSRMGLLRDDTLPGSLAAFTARFADDAACADLLRRWKYGERGFVCPRCGGTQAWAVPSRRLDECRACHKQVSLTAGTVMHGTRKPLRLWFLALFLFVQSKQGVSALELQRALGLGSYQTAWAWLQKLRRCVGARDKTRLREAVEADETWEGGVHTGHPGRPTAGEKKALIAAAVEVAADRRQWGRTRLDMLPDGSAASLRAFLAAHVAPGTMLYTDDWRPYRKPARDLGLVHQTVTVSTSARKAHDVLPATHRVFALLHRVLLATYQGGVRHKHLPAYLAEFEFRFNRRRSASRGLLFQRLLSTAVHTAPPCYWQIVGRRDARTSLAQAA